MDVDNQAAQQTERIDKLERDVRRDRLIRRIGAIWRWGKSLIDWIRKRLAKPAAVATVAIAGVCGVAVGAGLSARSTANETQQQLAATSADIASARQAADDAVQSVGELSAGMGESADNLEALAEALATSLTVDLRDAVAVLNAADAQLSVELEALSVIDDELASQDERIDDRLTVTAEQFQASLVALSESVEAARATERQAREDVDRMVLAAIGDLSAQIAANNATDAETRQAVQLLAASVASLTDQLATIRGDLDEARARLDGWDAAQVSLCAQSDRANWNPPPPFC